ncbi:hypothetical protein TNCV_1483121 [Trichonephila clavipes]|nr:hypothetical protein TNCV_1483121 [Trichonephila clavipes]
MWDKAYDFVKVSFEKISDILSTNIVFGGLLNKIEEKTGIPGSFIITDCIFSASRVSTTRSCRRSRACTDRNECWQEFRSRETLQCKGVWRNSCPQFDHSITKDSLCGRAMHVKSVENSNVLLLVWCGS